MVRPLSSSLSPWARLESLSAVRRSPVLTKSISQRVLNPQSHARSLSSFATRSKAFPTTSATPSPSSQHFRTFASSSLLDQAFKASAPVLGRKLPPKGGKAPAEAEVKEEDEVDESTKEEKASESKQALKESIATKARVKATRASASAPGGAESPAAPAGGDAPPPAAITKRSVPDFYPQVLALPITRRPLFPGFYKAVVIRNPAVVAAIKEAVKKGQPYIGAFLLKDETADSDIITDLDTVHPVGVFAQITSTFPAPTSEGVEPGLTAVLYPHRRIRITDVLPIPVGKPPSAPVPEVDAELEGVLNPAAGSVVVEVVDVDDTPVPTLILADADSTKVPETTEGAAIGADLPEGVSHTAFLQDYAVSIVNVENVSLEPYDKKSPLVRAVASEIISTFKEIAQLNPLFRDQIANFSMSQSSGNVLEEPEKLADFAAAVSTGEVNELQDVLESTVLEDRLQKSFLVLKKELMNARLQSKLSKEVEGKIQKRQREYYLTEQLKGIKKELGIESDGKDKLVDKFKEKAATLNMPEAVRKVFDEEINKLSTLEPAASEFNVTRNYLDWLTQIPWGMHSEENFDLKRAVKVLDEDHYGLKDVKDRILEFLAVGKLRGTVEGKILCFVGPPGVGKTSIGKSIARALDREFFRFSVGGLGDVAEIKGHRRTYVGAMPGKIIQALKKVHTENPLVLIDEVDKIGRGNQGDPASALLEMLDPEQNGQFLDHYLDVPVDLSRVLFVCTANSLDTIPAPLLDRMEVLEVSGYITEEKAAIASRYLAPQAKEEAGLKNADVTLTEDAVAALIRYYCRESGVRKLKQQIEKVYRKAALKIVQDMGENEVVVAAPEVVPEVEAVAPITASSDPLDPTADVTEVSPEEGKTDTARIIPVRKSAVPRKPLDVPSSVHVHISAENLLEYVGPPSYQKDRMYTKTSPVGVSCGLGYLGNGSGAVMPIEVTSMPGNGSVQLTGKLGEVIKESAHIALSFLKSHAFSLGLTDDKDVDLLNKRSIHLHMPEGAIGKEGPSAGIAILTALVSLFTKRGISADLAMTGEMTLAGQVLPVGGLKEKILAAHRAGIKKLIIPAACQADIEHNVPESVKEGIEIVYVENVAQVITHAFAGMPIVNSLSELNAVFSPEEDSKSA